MFPASRYPQLSASAAQNSKTHDFFQAVCHAFSDAEQSIGQTTDRYYTFGGLTVLLRFAGPALIPIITPAFAHLAARPVSSPDLTICLWDTASTGIRIPPLPWSEDQYLQFGLIDGFNSGRFKTLHQHALQMIDLEENKAIYWIPDSREAPYYHSITPLRTTLHWWLDKHDLFVVHAAAVGTSERGVLVTGKGGAGKSTTALSCIDHGLDYIGDENCLISIAPEPYAHSIYSSGTLEAEDVGRFPSLDSSLCNANRLHVEKAVYHLFDSYQQSLPSGIPIKAVFVPRVSGRPATSIQRRSSAQTLVALAPGSLFQLPGAGRNSFRAMADLLRAVPCYTLELGTDFSKIPIVIKDFLRNLPCPTDNR